MHKFIKTITLTALLLVQNGYAFEFKNFQSQLENAQKGLGKFIDSAQKQFEKQKEAQVTRERVQRDNEIAIAQAQVEAEIIKSKDGSYLVELNNLPYSAKWLMISARKENSTYKDGDTSIVKIVDKKATQKIYLKEGAGFYNILYFTSTSLNKYQGAYAYLNEVKLKNLDTTDKKFLLPSTEVQSDDPRIMSIAQKLSEGVTDQVELVKRIHDFVAENIEYNDEGYADGSFINDETDALTVLKTKKTVCAGYSSFFAAIARAAGIKTTIVHGPAKITKGWELHAWNEVFINGKWESIDVTWDDQSQVIYDYFMISAEKLSEDHKKESVQNFF